MKKLLLTGAYSYTNEQIKTLETLGYEIVFIQDERIELDFDVSGIHSVVCNSLFLYNDISDFKSLETIQLTSAGLDRVPLDYINKKEIQVYNAKGVYSIPMAEWVVLKILDIYKNSKFFYKNQEHHRWEKCRDLLELTDKTATIIGFGSVGEEVAKRLKSFGVKIIGSGRQEVKSAYVDESIFIDNLDEALIRSDIVVITLPLTKDTTHLINEKRIEKMKENAVLINVARGGIIDEFALIEALKNGKFLGVALDVFEKEPLEENPLWDFENVIITPHNSFVSDENRNRMFYLIYNNLRYIRTEVTK